MNERTQREQNIIGTMLVNSEAAFIAIERLRTEDFESGVFADVFGAIQKLVKQGKPITAAGISNYIKSDPEEANPYDTLSKIQTMFSYLDAAAAVQSMYELTEKAIEDSYKQKIEQVAFSSGTASEIYSKIATLEEERLQRVSGSQGKPDNMQEYLKAAFEKDLKEFQKSNTIKTGLKNYDDKTGGLFPGLYVIGAVSSLGKTTLTHQICDNIAKSGHAVLFFSLEQSKLELITKSIARINAQQQLSKGTDIEKMGLYCTPAIHIRQNGVNSGESKAALNEYINSIADNMNIIEGNFNTTVEYIRSYTKRYINSHTNTESPVVVVDYLQIMQNAGNGGNNKDNVDRNVTELKRLSRDLNIPVIVVSSFNRNNYMIPVSFESFKESGGIEYTADVVIGLQLTALNDELFNKEGNIKAKREKLKEAKMEIPRKIQLCCLKNRNGVTSFDLFYNYYPLYDLFVVDQSGGVDQQSNKPKTAARI